MVECGCREAHERRRIVLTGGPGAGKTAVLEMVRRSMCEHVVVLPESASIVFSGGFPRDDHDECLRAAQRAIFHVQRELEVTGNVHGDAIVLCDRGTIDGLAYWPGPIEDFWATTGAEWDTELARYDVVIHLRTPSPAQGYNHANPVRTESASAAAAIDERILHVWERHPRRYVVESSGDFLDKATRALTLLRGELPECCARNLPASLAASPDRHL